MGNKQVNLRKRQMTEMRKAVDNKATTKIVALIKSYAEDNDELVKEGCQALFYSLGREVSSIRSPGGYLTAQREDRDGFARMQLDK